MKADLYSCDDHLDLWNLPREVWEGRLASTWGERGPRVTEINGGKWWTCDGSVLGMFGMRGMPGLSATTRTGVEDDGFRASNPELRLADMDLDGVRASVIYGPNLLGLAINDVELKAAVLAAYNDWAVEFNQHAPDRLCVLPVLPTHAPQAAVAELERVARNGHRGAIINPFEFLPSDPTWEPLWAAAAACGLPLSFHIGGGTSRLNVAWGGWELAAWAAVTPKNMDEPLAMMIFAGPLERHPDLKLVFAECGVGWLPYFIARMDQMFEKHTPKATDYRIKTKPSELFRRQIMATFEEEPFGPQLIPLVGADNCMWASDYPHPDSTFPHSRDAIAEAFRGLDAGLVEKVTVTNCKRLYGFP